MLTGRQMSDGFSLGFANPASTDFWIIRP